MGPGAQPGLGSPVHTLCWGNTNTAPLAKEINGKNYPGFRKGWGSCLETRADFTHMRQHFQSLFWTHWIFLAWENEWVFKLVGKVLPRLVFPFLLNAPGRVVLPVSLLDWYIFSQLWQNTSLKWRYCVKLCCDTIVIASNKYYPKGCFLFVPFKNLDKCQDLFLNFI